MRFQVFFMRNHVEIRSTNQPNQRLPIVGFTTANCQRGSLVDRAAVQPYSSVRLPATVSFGDS